MTPAQFKELTDYLGGIDRTLKEGLGTNFGDMTPLQGVAISLKSIQEDMLSIACALERIADAQEKARTV